MSDTSHPRRRDLLFGGVLGAAAAGTGVAAVAAGADSRGPAVHTDRRVRWRLASSFPAQLDAMFGSAELLAEEVRAMSEGAFEITAYQGGELVGPLQVMDAVQQGAIEMGQTASYYYTGKSAALAFETCVPFGLTARQQSAWLEDGGGYEVLRPLFDDFGVVPLPAGNTGTQMGGWFRRPIETAEDLRGLKMRIPGLGGKVMDQLGVAVQVLGGAEIYPALERGAIDATEWVGPYDDLKLGFHQVAKNYYYPGWWEPGPHLAFYVGRAAWDGLPEAYRQMLVTAARRAASMMQTRYDGRNPAALEELRGAGVAVRPFSEEILREARDASEQMLSDEAARDATYRRVLEAWRGFRKASFGWFATAELEYARFAYPG